MHKDKEFVSQEHNKFLFLYLDLWSLLQLPHQPPNKNIKKKKEKKNLLQLLPSLFDPYGLSLQLVFVFSSFGGQYLFFS